MKAQEKEMKRLTTTGQCLDKQFENIWAKGGKSKQKIMDKLRNRKINQTYDNCRDYFLGRYIWILDSRTGNGEHINRRTQYKTIRRLKYAASRTVENKYRKKNRKSNK